MSSTKTNPHSSARVAAFDDSGVPTRVSDTNGLPIQGEIGVTLPQTVFGELLVGELTPQFQGSFEYTVSNTTQNTNTLVNTGTVTQEDAKCVVESGTTTASTALFQTTRHAKYRAGLGASMRFTAMFTTPVADTEQYAGIMDEVGSSAAFKNGLGVGYNGTTFGFHRWSNDTLTTVAQSAWDDPLDGTGASGMTLDQTKINIFFIRYRYLGVGMIELWVENSESGELVCVHKLLHSNTTTVPHSYNPNYHFTLWVNNGSTTDDMAVSCASYAYFIEGNTIYKELQQPNFTSPPQTEAIGNNTDAHIITIRNKSTYASKTNYLDILLNRLSTNTNDAANNATGTIRLVLNADLSGDSWTDINTTDSVIEYDTSATVTNGTDIYVGYLAGKNASSDIDLKTEQIILPPTHTISIMFHTTRSTEASASLMWKELV